MSTIKGILLDVDRTITRDDKTISPRTIAAIRRIEASHYKIGLCTGRQWAFLTPVVMPIFQRPGYHVVAGGGQLVDEQGTVIKAHNLPLALVQQLQQLANRTSANLVAGQGDTVFSWQAAAIPDLRANAWVSHAATWPQGAASASWPLIVVTPLLPAVEQQLQLWQDEGLLNYKPMVSRKGVYYADVTAPGVTKAVMLKHWARLHHLQLADLAAVGDGNNDLEMIASVGVGVAMGNAVTALKEKAKIVIGSNQDDGLAAWLESLL
jgi:Cof subfamily protein (haloacid dehalogenase superfamily)